MIIKGNTLINERNRSLVAIGLDYGNYPFYYAVLAGRLFFIECKQNNKEEFALVEYGYPGSRQDYRVIDNDEDKHRVLEYLNKEILRKGL